MARNVAAHFPRIQSYPNLEPTSSFCGRRMKSCWLIWFEQAGRVDNLVAMYIFFIDTIFVCIFFVQVLLKLEERHGILILSIIWQTWSSWATSDGLNSTQPWNQTLTSWKFSWNKIRYLVLPSSCASNCCFMWFKLSKQINISNNIFPCTRFTISALHWKHSCISFNQKRWLSRLRCLTGAYH